MYTPPGWPAGVHPPGSEEFESTAVTWLLDEVPPDYRLHGVLRRYPVALAATARAVGLVERALRGEVFAPKMQDKPPPRGLFRKPLASMGLSGLCERSLQAARRKPSREI